MKLLITFSVLVFAVIVYQTNGLCNTCSNLTSLACVENDKFRFCDHQGKPQGPVFICPSGTLCTLTIDICDSSPNAEPQCQRCGTCNDNKVFACTKHNAFSLCKGDVIRGNQEYTCANGLVCNADTNNIFIDPEIMGIGGTCPLV